jgi:hypothetical protein
VMALRAQKWNANHDWFSLQWFVGDPAKQFKPAVGKIIPLKNY